MINEKIINGVMLGLSVLGYAISGVSLILGHKQAKIHRSNDKKEIIEEVLKQIKK